MWLLLNSAGRCRAALLHTGVLARPRLVVRRKSLYSACSCSIDSACDQIMKSASARRPATS
ncbi:Uncharacterised protein [Mycobacteroides abscessus subsp. abscessus]|nr:Uncharacterised protein [Mycobacteroides abscessus subsp. abscessus]